MTNPFLPLPVKVTKVTIETDDRNIKSFNLSFVNEADRQNFHYVPGQFAQLSILGKGEAPFGIASSPTQPDLQFTVNRAGTFTTALHNLEAGQIIGVRGPLGNGFPMKSLEGKNVVIVGGGFAFTTLRSLTEYMLFPDNRKRFGNITVVYGARNPGLLLYKEQLREWGKRDDIRLHLTVDAAADGWAGKVGVVPKVLKEVAPKPDNAYLIVCGPPVMLRYSIPAIKELGFPAERTLLSLEMRMKCGLGMCGRCNTGSKYICKDGPVFSLQELTGLHWEV